MKCEQECELKCAPRQQCEPEWQEGKRGRGRQGKQEQGKGQGSQAWEDEQAKANEREAGKWASSQRRGSGSEERVWK